MEKTEGPITVIIADESERLDVYLAKKLDLSRSYLHKLIKEGAVLVNRAKPETKSGYKLRVGDKIIVTIPAVKKIEVEAQDIPLEILYEDPDLLVLNKPAGMTVHPVGRINKNTLVNALLHHCRELSQIGGCFRPGIVHRLDKDTSGVMVVAKNDRAHRRLSAQFGSHQINKTYLTLVWGTMSYRQGSIDLAIGRASSDRTKMKVTGTGRPSKTSYEVVKQYSKMALLKIFPQTGRTHQIRVHLSYLKHPVVGDRKYGCSWDNEGIGRQMLHAETLTFIHPVTGIKMTFKAELPQDFKDVIKANS